MATDTTQSIKEIQTALWLAKTPEERLRIFLRDNDAFMSFVKSTKKQIVLATSNQKPI